MEPMTAHRPLRPFFVLWTGQALLIHGYSGKYETEESKRAHATAMRKQDKERDRAKRHKRARHERRAMRRSHGVISVKSGAIGSAHAGILSTLKADARWQIPNRSAEAQLTLPSAFVDR